METIKYTKTELRKQQVKLTQLQRYLPTLQLKKAMLQLEINQAGAELDGLRATLESCENKIRGYQQLLSSEDAGALFEASTTLEVKKRFENIAGVEIPVYEQISFQQATYFLFDTPYWLETAVHDLRHLIELREKATILTEKKTLLEKELRDVSIRVNLFEKILIPRTRSNIKKVKIFLEDQQLAAVSQAKMSKRKILKRKERLAS